MAAVHLQQVRYQALVVENEKENKDKRWIVPPSNDVDMVSPGQRGGTDLHGNVLAFSLSDDQRLIRFLVLGADGGTFYSTPKELKEENAACITRFIERGEGQMVIEKVLEVTRNGRAIRMNASLLALAMCCRSSDKETRAAGYRAIGDVCNIPTHLFNLVALLEKQGSTTGWGRGLRKAVSQWYNQHANNPRRLAMLVTKYRQRDGWSHRDLLRLSHLTPGNVVLGFILRYTVKGLEEAKKYYLEDGHADSNDPNLRRIVDYLEAVEEVRLIPPPPPQKRKIMEGHENVEEPMVIDSKLRVKVDRAVELIEKHDLVREHLPTFLLSVADVWSSLLDKIPFNALLRNLAKMTSTGVLNVEENLQKVFEKLENLEALKYSKVHPYNILTAWHIYREGKGVKGRLRWLPNPKLVVALEKAFYASFGIVTPTHKRILIALDVSGSMTWETNRGSGITPRVGSVAMSLVTMAAETNVDVVGFSDELRVLDIDKNKKLEEAVDYINNIPMGSTDCSLPMLWAAQTNRQYDAFIIYTDCETWYSRMQPVEALRLYRQQSGITNARLAVVGMASNGFTLADPADLYMMDVVGFDAEAPAALQEFISGSLESVSKVD
ncbi:RNA-binding protein RO60-like [Littorina saxatilis]|uniref:TROVE domain-containing protein n=1 Tax=Littorina saxatilis TaxID=31220 RepID=A0AAN9B2C6_9CAEN